MKLTRSENCVSQVMATYADLVLRLAVLHLRNRADAEDVFQDVFIKLFETEREFNDHEHLKAWLIRTTTNRCKNHLASFWHRNRSSLDEVVMTVEDQAERGVLVSLMALSAIYRSVIYLYYYEGYSTGEIATLLELNEATVRTRLKRGRDLLKQILIREGTIIE